MLDVVDVVTSVQDCQPGKLRQQLLLNTDELLLVSSWSDFADFSLHIPLPRLLNKLKDDDFLSHMLNQIIVFSLSSIYISHPGFHGPHISTQPLLLFLVQVCLPCRMNSVSPSFPSPQINNSHLLTTCLHPLHPQIPKAVIPSPWRLPLASMLAYIDSCRLGCLPHLLSVLYL